LPEFSLQNGWRFVKLSTYEKEPMAKLILKSGRERSIKNFHPWIFSGAIERIDGTAAAGEAVDVHSSNGDFLARGFFCPSSQIRCRLLTWQDEKIDRAFLARSISASHELRRRLLPGETDAYRVVNAEGDGLPGLIVDRYAGIAVMQCNTIGMETRKREIAEILMEVVGVSGVWERSQGAARREEGLQPSVGVLDGSVPDGPVAVRENGFLFEVDFREGQKTGFFLDQRENRLWLKTLVEGKLVLNCFSYTGAFSVYAAAGGASRVVSVESSSPALEQCKRHMQMNDFSATEEDFVLADVFAYLRAIRQNFEFIILDPPGFAHHHREVDAAARAYKDINLQALKRIVPGGMLLSCSCSQPVAPELFQKILFAAASDANRRVRIIGQRGHAADHPISIFHPEGRYLQAWLLSVE
jgi:23S rRNA (cytosine1962-C5)-methyltransferase